MKRIIVIVATFSCTCAFSCTPGKGCRGNGKNVGAERILSGDKKALKEAGKAGKFRS